jgi:hypothetical protein
MHGNKITWIERVGLAVLLVFASVCLSCELFEDILNLGFAYDDFFSVLLALSAYAWLIHVMRLRTWRTYTVVGLLAIMAVVDWFSSEGALWDDLIAIIAIGYMVYQIRKGLFSVKVSLG